MNIKLSEEKIRILKEEGTHFKDAIDGRMYYQYPREVYKETDNEFIFELVDKVLEPIELPSDEKIEKEAVYFSDSLSIYDTAKDDTLYGFREGANWVIKQIKKQK